MTYTHVCLVSAQPIPNLIPLRMEEIRPKKVILLVSPDMKLQSERLENVIKEWGIQVDKYPIAPYDLNSARETCISILSKYNNDEEIILNATGGTKIMAFAAFEVFRENGLKIIYVDTQNGWIQALSPQPKQINFKDVLKVHTYLRAYGQKILNEKTNIEIKRHSPVIDELIKIFDIYQDAIKILNSYVAPWRSAGTFPIEIEIKQNDLENENFQKIIKLFAENNIFEFNNGLIKFLNIDDVEFASGGWLEEYVYRTVKSLSVVDVRMGVEVMWDVVPSKPPKNEYDVVFIHNNRLFLIECKTERFEGIDKEVSTSDPIYKLESLRDAAGGVYGKGMLVSYQRLTDTQKRRLAANKLFYCDSTDLKNLKSRIAQWIR